MRRTRNQNRDPHNRPFQTVRTGGRGRAVLLAAILLAVTFPARIATPANAHAYEATAGIQKSDGAWNTRVQEADSTRSGLLNLEFELNLNLLVLEIRWSGRLRLPGDRPEAGLGSLAMQVPGVAWKIARSILEQGS